ncbi:MAG: histidinol-phosphate transaminase [Mariprofundaceae bacterium]|nr:histidinol-phosphate transaminase [Mariprofundaceae bacterium]
MMSMDWMNQTVPQARGLYPYIPGKPIEQLLREKGLTKATKLASNENAYGPSPKAIQAMHDAILEAHRYPDGDAHALKAALADKHQLDAAQILLGNGSNEVLELVIRCFAGLGDEVIYSQHGFIVYALATQASGANRVPVQDTPELGHDLDAMLAAVTKQTKIVCIANPNNPTGTLLSNDALQRFLNALPPHIIIILDEAYDEFVCDIKQDSVQHLHHPGLVISRTFSKAYGLAACRVGYAMANANLLEAVNRFREPFNLNSLAQAAALAALDDLDWVMEKVDLVKQERTRLELALAQQYILAGKSFGNFVLLQHPKALELHQQLENLGLITRPLAAYGLPELLRISVGKHEENNFFLKSLDTILATMNTQS